MTVRVVVDSKEVRFVKPVISHLKSKGFRVDVEPLPFGDFLVEGNENYVVERKTLGDLCRSVTSARLWEQLEGLKTVENAEPLLLVELTGRLGEFEPSSLYGLMLAVALGWKIPMVFTLKKSDTALLLERLCVRASTSKRQAERPLFKPKAETVDEKVLRVVASLPSVEYARARSLLRRFKTLRNLFRASMEELMEVEGIGPATAKEICDILDYQWEG
jgi:ERCC4-type nuclease